MAKEKKDKTAFDKLNAKQKSFFEAYLETFNARKAYQKIHPTSKNSTAYTNGCKLLKNAKIKDALKEYYDQLWENKQDYVGILFKKLLNMADFDISDYIDEYGGIDLAKLNKENSFPVSEVTRKVTETKDGVNVHESIKTVDKIKAIQELTKILGMIQEKVEHTGTINVVKAVRPDIDD